MSETMKILLLGDNYVGKTSLATTYCEGSFPMKTIVTIGVNVYHKTVKIGKDDIKLQLYDTASQERFMDTILNSYTKDTNALVFVYDITDYLSFHFAKIWIEVCESHLSNFPQLIKVLIGTKCDLEYKRQVKVKCAKKLADKYGMEVYEVSSKSESDREELNSVFITLANKYRNEQIANKIKNVHRNVFDF